MRRRPRAPAVVGAAHTRKHREQKNTGPAVRQHTDSSNGSPSSSFDEGTPLRNAEERVFTQHYTANEPRLKDPQASNDVSAAGLNPLPRVTSGL